MSQNCSVRPAPLWCWEGKSGKPGWKVRWDKEGCKGSKRIKGIDGKGQKKFVDELVRVRTMKNIVA